MRVPQRSRYKRDRPWTEVEGDFHAGGGSLMVSTISDVHALDTGGREVMGWE